MFDIKKPHIFYLGVAECIKKKKLCVTWSLESDKNNALAWTTGSCVRCINMVGRGTNTFRCLSFMHLFFLIFSSLKIYCMLSKTIKGWSYHFGAEQVWGWCRGLIWPTTSSLAWLWWGLHDKLMECHCLDCILVILVGHWFYNVEIMYWGREDHCWLSLRHHVYKAPPLHCSLFWSILTD